MTDLQENTDVVSDESSAAPAFKANDPIVVKRGKLARRTGSVLKYSPQDQTYALTLDDGTLAVVNATNVKAPEGSSISVHDLASVLARFRDDETRPTAWAIAKDLDEVSPGISGKLEEAWAGNV
jgi:hypothetical protein